MIPVISVSFRASLLVHIFFAVKSTTIHCFTCHHPSLHLSSMVMEYLLRGKMNAKEAIDIWVANRAEPARPDKTGRS